MTTRTVELPVPKHVARATPLPFTIPEPTEAAPSRQGWTPPPSLVVEPQRVVLLRPQIAATFDPNLDRRELELAWGCQVILDDLLRDHGFNAVVDRRDVVESAQQDDPLAYAVQQSTAIAPGAALAVLTRFDREAPGKVRAEGIIVDLHAGRVVTRGRAEKTARKLMAWLAHIPDHVAFALGETTPKVSWREYMGVRDAERALSQVRLAGALARLARLGADAA